MAKMLIIKILYRCITKFIIRVGHRDLSKVRENMLVLHRLMVDLRHVKQNIMLLRKIVEKLKVQYFVRKLKYIVS